MKTTFGRLIAALGTGRALEDPDYRSVLHAA